MTINERIREARLAKGWSMDELARQLGYASRATVSRVEAGQTMISHEMLVKYCEALEVSPLWLLYGDGVYTDANGFMWLHAPLDADYRIIASAEGNTIGGDIKEGDTLYIKRGDDIENGKLALIEVEGVQMLAYWHYNPEHPSICLTSLNPGTMPMLFIGEEIGKVKLMGQVVFYLAEPRGLDDGNDT